MGGRALAVVLFDAYGTLIDLRGVHAMCVRRILERAGLKGGAGPPGAAPGRGFEEEFHACWDSRERANLLWAAARDFRREPFVTQLQLNIRSLRETFERFGIEGDAESGVELWVELTRRAGIFDDVRAALEALPEGLRAGVVSNSDNYPLIEILEREGLDFEVVVTSETARAYKPNPRIFRFALKAAGAPAVETVFIGDTPEIDVPGARAAGIETVWLDRARRGPRAGGVEPDATIHALSELPPLLERLRRS